jgi:N-acetylglucosaminyl-diphospho-decaprenol L-rhamnosyltransferase
VDGDRSDGGPHARRGRALSADVHVIIVSYNTRADLDACLASLFAAPPACVAGVTVVDNASGDGSPEMVRSRYPAVEVVALDKNAGFGAANNVALRRCSQPLALLLNSDTIVPTGAIDTLRARLIARGAVAAGPKLVDAQGRQEVSFGPMLTPLTELVQRSRVRAASRPGPSTSARLRKYLAAERFVDWVTGACMLLDVRAVSGAGFFDERFFMYEEDVDLCATLRAAGGKVLFTPAAEVIHLRGRSSAAPSGAAADSHYDRSHIAFYEKHAPGWAVWLKLWLRLRGRPVR